MLSGPGGAVHLQPQDWAGAAQLQAAPHWQFSPQSQVAALAPQSQVGVHSQLLVF